MQNKDRKIVRELFAVVTDRLKRIWEKKTI